MNMPSGCVWQRATSKLLGEKMSANKRASACVIMLLTMMQISGHGNTLITPCHLTYLQVTLSYTACTFFCGVCTAPGVSGSIGSYNFCNYLPWWTEIVVEPAGGCSECI